MTGQGLGPEFAAIVLSGGRAVRLGGADKASIEVAGQTLLEHALAALADIPEVVVVGAEVPTSRPVTFTREDPAGGGPAAGLLAGLRTVLGSPTAGTPAWVLVLAVDMPLVTRDTVRRLAAAVRNDGAVLVDQEGQVQYLCAAYSVAALERAGQQSGNDAGHGLAMRRLVSALDLAHVLSSGSETRDLDTWDDLADLRETLDERGHFGSESQDGQGDS